MVDALEVMETWITFFLLPFWEIMRDLHPEGVSRTQGPLTKYQKQKKRYLESEREEGGNRESLSSR